jgi:hypothetical protein
MGAIEYTPRNGEPKLESKFVTFIKLVIEAIKYNHRGEK